MNFLPFRSVSCTSSLSIAATIPPLARIAIELGARAHALVASLVVDELLHVQVEWLHVAGEQRVGLAGARGPWLVNAIVWSSEFADM